MTKTTPYGAWKSPISAEMVASASVRVSAVALDGDDVYWIEGRPAERGRSVIVRRRPDGATQDLTPAPFNARTRVHEYGGGAYLVEGGKVYFSNYADQRLYRLEAGGEPEPITPESPVRYADGVIDPTGERIICVLEDHSNVGQEAVNSLVSLKLKSGVMQTLASGNDFYSTPRLSPDGTQLAWLTWNHPNMPWDGTELWTAEALPSGALKSPQKIAGGEQESIFQPEWSPDGTLYFVSDRSGWWNLYYWREGQIVHLVEMEAEFGRPQWLFGFKTYAFESSARIIAAYTQNGAWHLASIHAHTGEFEPIPTPYVVISDLQAGPGKGVFLAGSPTEPAAIVQLDLGTHEFVTLHRFGEAAVGPGYLSIAQPVEFPTANRKTAHALYYPPQNQDHQAPASELPPLLVKSHGGPTSATSADLNMKTQYWTSRGFAVLDVNYGGSTGYGRPYRQRLNGQWGVVDVEDCANGALHLVKEGLVDGERLAITGGSAGGYTTLCALTFREEFKTGASYYGVSDLTALALETHKFESRYMDSMVGPYPESKEIYDARSPIHHVDKLSRPVIFFQGLEDKVVPPNQAEMLVEALRAKGIPVAYLPFEGEGHGFRRAENIQKALQSELYFYSRILGFDLSDEIEPVEIDNL